MKDTSIRKGYTKEFKLETIQLVLTEKKSCASVERDLDIGKGVVSRWIWEFTADTKRSFPGKGDLKPQQDDIHQKKDFLLM